MRPDSRRSVGEVAPRALMWVTGFTMLLLSASAAAWSERESSAGARLVPAEDERLVQYRAFRRMHVRSDKFGKEGWMDAWTELDGQGFRYRIVHERGSEYIRDRVLRTLLEREQAIVAEGGDRAALTDANYVFTEPIDPVDGARYVLMKPRRKDVVLVDGRVVLTADGSGVVRVEGRLAKNPSFWTTKVDVIRHFASVEGVRVPVSTETVARIRFAGESRLDVTYEYESINGRPVSAAARLRAFGASAGQARDPAIR